MLIRLKLLYRTNSSNLRPRFDLSPLFLRAEEFAESAREIDNEQHKCESTSALLSRHRYELAEIVSKSSLLHSTAEWMDLNIRVKAACAKRLRNPSLSKLDEKLQEIRQLREEADSLLKMFDALDSSAIGTEIRRHIHNTDVESLYKKTEAFEEGPVVGSMSNLPSATKAYDELTWDLIPRAYPELEDYNPAGEILSQRDVWLAAETVARTFQIAPGTWSDACATMGCDSAAATVAYMLQKGVDVRSPGAYFNTLTKLYRQGSFSPARQLKNDLLAATRRQAQTAGGDHTKSSALSERQRRITSRSLVSQASAGTARGLSRPRVVSERSE